MASLISIYNFDGSYINQFLGEVGITQNLGKMDRGTLIVNNSDIKVTPDLFLPGNLVLVSDESLSSPWIGVIVPPTSTNPSQSTVALVDIKNIFTGMVILSTEGLGLGITVLESIQTVIQQANPEQWLQQITYDSDNNGFALDSTSLEQDSSEYLGVDLYSFLNQTAEKMHFEWWLEPDVSKSGILGLSLRTADLRSSEGDLINTPKNGAIKGLGLTYSNKYATALAVIRTIDTIPSLEKVIVFDELVDKFGLITKVIVQTDSQSINVDAPLTVLFKDLRPRRTVQLHIETSFEELISTIELGSVHQTVLGDIGLNGASEGIILTMRVIALSYTSGEHVIGVVLEEFFEITDDLSNLN